MLALLLAASASGSRVGVGPADFENRPFYFGECGLSVEHWRKHVVKYTDVHLHCEGRIDGWRTRKDPKTEEEEMVPYTKLDESFMISQGTAAPTKGSDRLFFTAEVFWWADTETPKFGTCALVGTKKKSKKGKTEKICSTAEQGQKKDGCVFLKKKCKATHYYADRDAQAMPVAQAAPVAKMKPARPPSPTGSWGSLSPSGSRSTSPARVGGGMAGSAAHAGSTWSVSSGSSDGSTDYSLGQPATPLESAPADPWGEDPWATAAPAAADPWGADPWATAAASAQPAPANPWDATPASTWGGAVPWGSAGATEAAMAW